MQPVTTTLNYQSLVHSLPGLYLILSPDCIILDATDAFLQATLRSRQQIKGRYIFDMFPDNPENTDHSPEESLRRSLLHVLKCSTPHTMPVQRYDIQRPANLGGGFEERYWLISNHPVMDEHGQLLYIVSHLIDVTMQQMAHHLIEINRERVEILAQATTDVIWDVDLLSNHLWWSESLKTIFGYEIHELPTNEDWALCVHPDDQERVVTGMDSVVKQGGRIWTDSYRFRRKDGTYANVLERGYILRDEKGIAYRMVGSMFDITNQVEPEQQTCN